MMGAVGLLANIRVKALNRLRPARFPRLARRKECSRADMRWAATKLWLREARFARVEQRG